MGLASLLHTGTVLIAGGLVDELLAAAPQVAVLASENRDLNDGRVLLHLLLPDVLRLTVAAFHAGDVVLATRILTVAAHGLRDGDEYVRNAVAVSFVEHFGAHPGESDELLALWPPLLRAELGR
jgi:hypothetical protein